jgi:hemin uptake protein HemP
MAEEKAEKPAASTSNSTPSDIPVIDVRDIMADGREAVLIHDGERYRLRITAKDKLLLTK